MGCGAYGCPTRLVANEMKAILLDPEFKGWFRKVVFAVYSKDDQYYFGTASPTNFAIFSEVFSNTTLNA